MVSPDERWVVLGPNGCGKTTLSSVIAARLQPSTGTATVLGVTFGRGDLRELDERIGHLSHAVADRIAPGMRAVDVVLTGKRSARAAWFQRYDEEDLANAAGLLADVGCSELVERPIGSCSQGERQRVLLARAMFGDPPLWSSTNMAFYPGEQGGTAIARVLTGEVYPSGKLPFTVPRDPSQLPPFDNRSLEVEYGYYHGYTLAEKKGWEPRYPFGHGLGYSRFAYSGLARDAPRVGEDGAVTVQVDVTNTGARAGEEVVQLYVGFPMAKVDRPLKLLRGFEKVALGAGETKRVRLAVRARDLAYWDVSSRSWKVERATHTVLAGPSSRATDLLSVSFDVTD